MHERYRIEIGLLGERNPIIATGHLVRVENQASDEWSLAFQFEVINPDDKELIRAAARVVKEPVDRRVDTRLAACIPAKLWILGSATPAFTKDLSASGIRVQIATPCRFQVGELHRIEIELPKHPRPIRAWPRRQDNCRGRPVEQVGYSSPSG